MIPQYKIFYSWQSDDSEARSIIRKGIKTAIAALKKERISIEMTEGGGGLGFVSIEDAVRMKIQQCDIFIGDVTPVGVVNGKDKLLPNANVMYEMGIATECLTANQIIAVALSGDWKVENMPFDFRQYSMVRLYKTSGAKVIEGEIKKRIKEVDRITRAKKARLFSERLLKNNIASGKYLTDAFLENRVEKDKARLFVTPYQQYNFFYKQLLRMNFDLYNRRKRIKYEAEPFALELGKFDLRQKSIDLKGLGDTIKGLKGCLQEAEEQLSKDQNHGWIAASKLRKALRIVEVMDKQLMVVTSEAGQGKTNFLCDIVENVLRPHRVPYIFVNAYELSAESLARSIALEYNFIGDGSLEKVMVETERYCNQQMQMFVIIIDGLNEHPQQNLFRNNLYRVLNALCGYRHVRVLMTCRGQFFENNYKYLRGAFEKELIVESLDPGRHEEKLEKREADCIIERYGKHFQAKGILHPAIRRELVDNLLLLRIFYETHQGEDITRVNTLDYTEMFETYFTSLCDKIQVIIEKNSVATRVQGMAVHLFEKLLEFMIGSETFRNIPTDKVLATLNYDEQACFAAFLDANFILHRELLNGGGAQDVVNFTYDELRDFLIAKYMVEHVWTANREKFERLVDDVTEESNPLTEGTRRFLFLLSRKNESKEICDDIKKKKWYGDVFADYIWDVDEDKMNDSDIEQVKQLVKTVDVGAVRMLCYYHWSPARYKKLSLNTLFEVLGDMTREEQQELLDKVWPDEVSIDEYSYRRRDSIRTVYVKQLQHGIERRKKEDDPEAEALKKMLVWFKTMGVLIPIIDFDDDDDGQIVYNLRGYDTYRYLMTTHSGNREDFLKEAGVKDGFSKQVMGDVYDSVFAEGIDIQEMYESLYKPEYENVDKFISRHYSITDKEAKEFGDEIRKGNRVIDFSSIDYGDNMFETATVNDDYFVKVYNWFNWK